MAYKILSASYCRCADILDFGNSSRNTFMSSAIVLSIFIILRIGRYLEMDKYCLSAMGLGKAL